MRNGTENEDDHEKNLKNLKTFHLGKEKSGDDGILVYCSNTKRMQHRRKSSIVSVITEYIINNNHFNYLLYTNRSFINIRTKHHNYTSSSSFGNNSLRNRGVY